MKEKNTRSDHLIEELIKGLEKSEIRHNLQRKEDRENSQEDKELIKEQRKEDKKRFDSVDDKIDKMAEAITTMVENNKSQNSTSKRIEENQIALGKDFKIYKQNNDDRVVEIEKHVINLENWWDVQKKSKNITEKRKTGVIIGLTVLFVAALAKILLPLL